MKKKQRLELYPQIARGYKLIKSATLFRSGASLASEERRPKGQHLRRDRDQLVSDKLPMTSLSNGRVEAAVEEAVSSLFLYQTLDWLQSR